MAESLREEWSGQVNLIVGGIIGWDGDWSLFTSSPLAWSNGSTGSFNLSKDAFRDDSEIFCKVSWSTEVVIWDHGFSVTPLACCLEIAISCGSLVDASSKVTFN